MSDYKDKVTIRPVTARAHFDAPNSMILVTDDRDLIATIHGYENGSDAAEVDANAKLFVDALNVLRETGFAPRELAALIDLASACIEYVGPLDDPRVGWTGGGATHKDRFKCERCGAESLDCFAIPHADRCSAKRLIDALAKGFPKGFRP